MMAACVVLNLSLVLGLRWTGNRNWAKACLHTLYAWISVLILFALRLRPLREGLLDWFGAHAILMAMLMAIVTFVLQVFQDADPLPAEVGTGLSQAEVV